MVGDEAEMEETSKQKAYIKRFEDKTSCHNMNISYLYIMIIYMARGSILPGKHWPIAMTLVQKNQVEQPQSCMNKRDNHDKVLEESYIEL